MFSGLFESGCLAGFSEVHPRAMWFFHWVAETRLWKKQGHYEQVPETGVYICMNAIEWWWSSIAWRYVCKCIMWCFSNYVIILWSNNRYKFSFQMYGKLFNGKWLYVLDLCLIPWNSMPSYACALLLILVKNINNHPENHPGDFLNILRS